MKKRKIIEILFILIGISLIAFPILSAFINSYTQTVCISNYQEDVNKMSTEEKKKELEKAKEYNDSLNQDQEIDISLSEKQVENEHSNYYNSLNIGEIMAYISIPKIDVYLPIYHGVSEEVLQSGVGHIESTSLPVGGKGTHSVLAGHAGLARSKMFDNIDKLELGDVFYINVLDEVLKYEVEDINIVIPDDTSKLGIYPEKDYVTLVTCTPYMINTHRLLVTGERVELTEDDFNNESNNFIKNSLDINKIKEKRTKEIIISIIVFLFIFILLIVYILKGKRRIARILNHNRVSK